MNVLLVSENLFDDKKPAEIMSRFLTHSLQENIDALCISTSTNNYDKSIVKFKEKYGGKYPIIYGDNLNIEIYNQKYPLRSEGIINGDEMIYAMDDAICEIEFKRDQNLQYAYIPLDVFSNLEVKKEETAKAQFKAINGEDLLNGQPIAIPLQKFLDLIEETVDDETKEKIKKAKREFNEKTKS